MEGIILNEIRVEQNVVNYKFTLSSSLKPYFKDNELFVSYDRNMENVPEGILTIPFVGSFIALTWLTDSVLWVNNIDWTYYQAIKKIKHAFKELYPHINLKGRFVSAYLQRNKVGENRANNNKSILLFSGGLDAHTTYIRHRTKNLMLCNIQGWLKSKEDQSEAQIADFKDVKAFAEKEGRDCTLIKSNFASIINDSYFDKIFAKKIKGNWWYLFQHSMAFISIAIPMAYREGISEILIASSYSIGSEGLCASYPTTDNEFQFAENGHILHDGFELNRQDKVRVISQYQTRIGEKYPIRVCSFNDHNCGICPKCFRTILGIIAEGNDPSNFGFSLPKKLKPFYQGYISSHFIQFGIEKEAVYYWKDIKNRMIENLNNIQDKEFVDWFLNADLVQDRKKAVLNYRLHNFFPLLLKKIRNR